MTCIFAFFLIIYIYFRMILQNLLITLFFCIDLISFPVFIIDPTYDCVLIGSRVEHGSIHVGA